MTRRARLGAVARLALGAGLLLTVLFLAVFPTRTYLDQRDAISTSRHSISVLKDENERLRTRIEALQTPEHVEQLAREQYNLAKPGEEVFVVIPSEMEGLRRQGVTVAVVEAIRQSWGIPATSAPDS